MKMARGCCFKIARIASTFALHKFFSARTNASSDLSRSFHQPKRAENSAAMKISFAGVWGKDWGRVIILNPADPVGHAEVAEVCDGRDAEFAQGVESLVGERPVVAARAGVRAVVRRAVAEELYPQIFDELKVFAPALVVAALLHLVHALRLPAGQGDDGVAVLDAG